jgi:hypothetical protein
MPKGVLSYQRGEISWVKLDPTLGAEIQKTCVLGLVEILEDFYWPQIQEALLIVCGFGLDA